MCLIPDGDLFDAISRGRVEIATDEIETFTEHGIRLRSGRELEADLVVTATGLNLQPLGGLEPFFFQAEDGIRGVAVTGVQTCALPICRACAADPDGPRSGR